MKIYIAIGHFKGNKNITSIVESQITKKDFIKDCYGNGFVPYITMTEKTFNKILNYDSDSLAIFEQVKKMTTNYRVWNIITDYLEECLDIIIQKMKAVNC